MFYKAERRISGSSSTVRQALLGAAALYIAGPGLARAATFDLGGDWQASLNTTLSWSLGDRVAPRNSGLVSGLNTNDGDQNFDQGALSTNRFEALEEIQISRGSFGVQASGDAFWDSVYNTGTDNQSAATYNPLNSNKAFPRDTRNIQGRNLELLNAFTYGQFDVGGMPLSYRIGRHTLLFGQSLFETGNGVAAGMAAVDGIKALSVPGTEAKEVFLPTNQISAALNFAPGWSLQGYYQLEWRKTIIPGAGSYFSSADLLDYGGNRLFLDNLGDALYRTKDQRPADVGDQFGVGLTRTFQSIDVGAYFVSYDSKTPQLYLQPGVNVSTAIQKLGQYYLYYPTNIHIGSIAASTTIGAHNIGFELSVHDNVPLATNALGGVLSPGQSLRSKLYPTGKTINPQINDIAVFPGSALYDTMSVTGELAANYLMTIDGGKQFMSRAVRNYGVDLNVTFSPEFYRVFKHTDLIVPLTFNAGLAGNSPAPGSLNDTRAGTGSVTIGTDFIYKAVWDVDLSYTRYIGRPQYQLLADRDFVALLVKRAF